MLFPMHNTWEMIALPGRGSVDHAYTSHSDNGSEE